MTSTALNLMTAFVLVCGLLPSQMFGCCSECKCGRGVATQNGNAKSDCNARRCCSGQRSGGLGCDAIAPCCCKKQTAVPLIDVTQRANLATGVSVDGSSVLIKVIRSLMLPHTSCVHSHLRCSWQAFACVWIK